MTPRSFLAGLLLLASALLSWWLFEDATRVLNVPQAVSEREVDYYFDNFSLRSMNEQGGLVHQLRAPRLAFFPDSGDSEITRPEITLYDEDNLTWTVIAEQGTVSIDGKDLDLAGEVTLTQSPAANPDPYTIRTRDLHIRPDEETLTTRAPVTITNRQVTMQGRGMVADLAAGTLHLVSSVKATHNPQ